MIGGFGTVSEEGYGVSYLINGEDTGMDRLTGCVEVYHVSELSLKWYNYYFSNVLILLIT